MGPFGPEFLDSDEVRAAVTARDIGALYRLVQFLGVTQRQIADLTSQSQSAVCAILKGRQVFNVLVLERIADEFSIPRARMFLGYGEKGPSTPSTDGEMNEVLKRRILIAAALGQQFLNFRGEPITLSLLTPTNDPLPSWLFMVHVHAVRTVTELFQLGGFWVRKSNPRPRSRRVSLPPFELKAPLYLRWNGSLRERAS